MRIGNVIAICIDASLVSSMPVFRTTARKTITAVGKQTYKELAEQLGSDLVNKIVEATI